VPPEDNARADEHEGGRGDGQAKLVRAVHGMRSGKWDRLQSGFTARGDLDQKMANIIA